MPPSVNAACDGSAGHKKIGTSCRRAGALVAEVTSNAKLNWLNLLACSMYDRITAPREGRLVPPSVDRVHSPGGRYLKVPSKLWAASPSCLRLFRHCVRAAAARTFCTAGTNSAIKMAMIAITTSSSMSVNAGRGRDRTMDALLGTLESTMRNELGG